MSIKEQSGKWLSLNLEERAGALLDKIAEKGTIPESVHDIMRLTNSADSSIGPVVEALAKNASLAAVILKVANSPVYGQSHKIKDLRKAVIVIGMQEIHTMAAGLAMLFAFSTQNELSTRLNESAVGSASIARMLAKKVAGVDSAVAFLCGLLSEIGAMAFMAVDTKEYLQIWDQAVGIENRFELERERYGESSNWMGARVLERNELPNQVIRAVEASFDVKGEPLGRITMFSRAVAPFLELEKLPQIEIGKLTEKMGLNEFLTEEEILGACEDAASMIRGSAPLLDEDDVSEEETSRDSSQTEKTLEETVPLKIGREIRMGTESSKPKWLAPVICIAGVAIIAVVAYYFLV